MIKRGEIIGIGGISRSGKTFLANGLAAKLVASGRKVMVFDQDNFVFPVDQIPLYQGHTDWEIPESIDFDKFRMAVVKASEEYEYVIAEGLMVFYDPVIYKLFDKSIFIKISKEEFLNRKKYDQRWGKEPDWYIDHIWEGYLKYGQFPAGQYPDLLLDGNQLFDIEQIHQQVII